MMLLLPGFLFLHFGSPLLLAVVWDAGDRLRVGDGHGDVIGAGDGTII